jgi:hypothetical protein
MIIGNRSRTSTRYSRDTIYQSVGKDQGFMYEISFG